MKSKFSIRLKELRQEKEIGQIELAKIIGVSRGVISFWENGVNEPKMSYLILLAKYFEVSVDYLIGAKDW